MAERIAHRVNRSCPGLVSRLWRPYRRYRVLSFVESKRPAHKTGRADNHVVKVIEDIDCVDGLHFIPNELQLVRLVHRKPTHFRHQVRTPSIELMLGDIHTQHGKKFGYRPTAYQAPLLEANTPGCHICHLVSKAADQSPPQLPARPKLPVYLSGEWLSIRCEVRPLGLFLTRKQHYFSSNNTWRGFYQYYRDPNCIQPLFLLMAEGDFLHAGPSLRLRGGTNYNFRLFKAKVTPQDHGLVNNLNSVSEDAKCGSQGKWTLNVTQDVTKSGGCSVLGLQVPSTKYDVVKMEVDIYGNALLFLGDVDTDNEATSPDRRATSYQQPLIQCRIFPEFTSENDIYLLPHAQFIAMTGHIPRMQSSLGLVAVALIFAALL